jgi:hypothetical protein
MSAGLRERKTPKSRHHVSQAIGEIVVDGDIYQHYNYERIFALPEARPRMSRIYQRRLCPLALLSTQSSAQLFALKTSKCQTECLPVLAD